MAKQAVFTSAPRGVFPGTSGYCTVLTTEGLSRAMVEFMEKMSAYRINDTGPDGAKMAPTKDNYEKLLAINPANFAFVSFNYRGQEVKVLLKTFLAGFDSTGRLRKLSHFLVLEGADFCPAGPAWLGMQKGIFIGDWAGEPTTLEKDKVLPSGNMAAMRCISWEASAGDAGWAGKLAESAYLPDKQAVVIFDERCNPQNLLVEAVSLLPPEHRWKVTFSTNFADFPPNVICNWRFVPAGTSLAASYANRQDIVLIDLTRQLDAAPGAAAESARMANLIGPPQRMTALVDITRDDKTFALTEKHVMDDQDDYGIRFQEVENDSENFGFSTAVAHQVSEKTAGPSGTARQSSDAPHVPPPVTNASYIASPPKAPPPPPPGALQQQRMIFPKAALFLLAGAIGLISIMGSALILNAWHQRQVASAEDAAKKKEDAMKAEHAKKEADAAKKAEDTREAEDAAKKEEDAMKMKAEHAKKEADAAKKAEDTRKAEDAAKKAQDAKKEDGDPKNLDDDSNKDDSKAEKEKKKHKPAAPQPQEETNEDPFRDWTIEDVQKSAQFVRKFSDDGTTYYRIKDKDNAEEDIAASKFSEEDHAYVREWLKKKKN